MGLVVFLLIVFGQIIGHAMDPIFWVLSLIASVALASKFTYWTRVLIQAVIITVIMEAVSIWIWSINAPNLIHFRFDYLVSTLSYVILSGIVAIAFLGIASYRAKRRAAVPPHS